MIFTCHIKEKLANFYNTLIRQKPHCILTRRIDYRKGHYYLSQEFINYILSYTTLVKCIKILSCRALVLTYWPSNCDKKRPYLLRQHFILNPGPTPTLYFLNHVMQLSPRSDRGTKSTIKYAPLSFQASPLLPQILF